MKNVIVTSAIITGANEATSIVNLIEFLHKNPNTQVVIDIDDKNCAPNGRMARWIKRLTSAMSIDKLLNNDRSIDSRIGFHISGQWAYETVTLGKFPTELYGLLFCDPAALVSPFLQLDIALEDTHLFTSDPTALANLLGNISSEPFGSVIIEANGETKKFVQKLHSLTPNFAILYDERYGAIDKCYKYEDVAQGYITPVHTNAIAWQLNNVEQSSTQPTLVWLQANCSSKTKSGITLDFDKAKNYIKAIEEALLDDQIYIDPDKANPDEPEDHWAKYEIRQH